MSDDHEPQPTSETTPSGGSKALCALPRVRERELGPNVTPVRAQLIRTISKKWVNGTLLRYYFFDRDTDGEEDVGPDGNTEWRSYVGPEEQRAVVRRGFEAWREVGLGVSFREVSEREDAEIRIGFMSGDGSWSYLGRDVLDQAPSVDERTMNFGWDLTGPGEIDTVVHEIGHTLGFPHEHQNPFAGIVWDEEAVYAAMAAPPNEWTRDDTYYNILRKLESGEVAGSKWDPNSIMHYPFEAGLIKEPSRYVNGLTPRPGLSERDQALARHFYPVERGEYPELAPFRSELLDVAPGGQKNFWILPSATRLYHIQTFGEIDSLVVLFEDSGDELRYLSADDDSGVERNAGLACKLVKGRRYLARVRLFYRAAADQAAIMLW